VAAPASAGEASMEAAVAEAFMAAVVADVDNGCFILVTS